MYVTIADIYITPKNKLTLWTSENARNNDKKVDCRVEINAVREIHI